MAARHRSARLAVRNPPQSARQCRAALGAQEGITVELGEAPQLTVQSNAVPSLKLRDLERAISKLAAEQRQVIVLVGLEGMAYEEVAAVLNVPVGTVCSRLSRGRDQLRRLIGMRRLGS